MNILLTGSGGREHALAWKITQSTLCSQLYIAPGNGGTSQYGINVPIAVNDFAAIKDFVIQQKIELIVAGPEDPLVNGMYDYFEEFKKTTEGIHRNILFIGPSANGAQLEGSKSFSKKFMQRQQIPTAAYAEFTMENFEESKAYILQQPLPVVLKADGLAAGKGVIICQSHEEAITSITEMIIHKQFGEASGKVVIEEFLDGIEVSVFVLTDGKGYKIIGHAKDYKRIGEGDTGPNTGGMGCVSPVPFADEVFMKKVTERIIQPTIEGLQKEQIIYKGFIFFGLIMVKGEPFVIEYNCRMGDPETEVVMPRLKNDLVQLFLSVHDGTIADQHIEYDERACCTVVAVSKGYPGDYIKNIPISLRATENQSSIVFHAGTREHNGQLLTNGGRVFAVSSYGENIPAAVQLSTKALQEIHFDGMYYRNDIGYEFF